MQKLHPKTVWLFFFKFISSSVFRGIYFVLFLIFLFVKFDTILSGRAHSVVLERVGLVAFLLLILCYIWARWTYRFWGYQLGEDAIKIEKGVIQKKYISIPYERVQNIDIYRGILARLLKLSELHIQTAGYSGNYSRTEGDLPGLGVQAAEQLREDLIKRAKGIKQGL